MNNFYRLFFLFLVVFLLNASFAFATITGQKNETGYSYNADSADEKISTKKMFDGSYNIAFDTSSATNLFVVGESSKQVTWNNDTSLIIPAVSSISVNNIRLINSNDLAGTYFVISSGSTVENEANLTFDYIYVDDKSSSLSTNIEQLYANEIVNEGNFIITSGNENNVKITGEGILKINSDFKVNSEIKQANVDINAGKVKVSSAITASNTITIETAAEVESSAENLKAIQISNKGTINFNSGKNINASIKEFGKIKITNGAYIQNSVNNEINQTLITIESESGFCSSADDLKVKTIDNGGSLTFTGGTNKSSITGGGFLMTIGNLINETTINQNSINVSSGTFNNLQDAAITANKITISSNACLVTGISDINTGGNIENNGLFEINSSGTNNNIIIGTGTLQISSSVINSKAINQQTVRISSQLATSFENLTVENIELKQENSLLQITDDNDSVSSSLITGSGNIEKQGAGTLEFLKSNTYSGATTITSGAIKISSSSNLGSSRIDMNGGKLIVNSEDEIMLDNEINAIENNDVNIEVVSSTLTLTQQISGNGNFVKTGSGTINLQAEQNNYTGDTRVLAGTLRGTTSNINGKLIGTGDENADIFEFCDNDTDVVLNEIDITNYVGTFNKIGSSTMTVTNNFKAENSNITNGVFVVNNIENGKTFEVGKDIKFTNSYIKGNADIKAEKVIIGDNAVISPGNSTGTIKISGDLVFEDNSSYQAEIGQKDAELYNDKIEVNSVNISNNNTSLHLISIDGSYYQKAIFEIIKSNSNIETGFSTVTVSGLNEEDLAFESRIACKVYNEANSMKVEISRKATDFANSPYLNLSHNQKEAAKAMDSISSSGQTGGDILTVLQKLESYYYYKTTQDFDKLKASFDDIAGAVYANSAFLTYFNAKTEHVYDKIQERISDNGCYKFHSKIWAEYFYNNVNVEKNSNSAKFDSTVNGIFAGFDVVSSKSLTLGITAGYGQSKLKQNSDSTDMKDVNLGVYGGFEDEKWQIKAMALTGIQQYDTTRQINFVNKTASSSYNGYNVALDGQAGYKIELTQKNAEHKINLIPFIGFMGNYNSIDGVKEKGAYDLNLKVNSYNNFAVQARLGAGLNGKVNKFGWYGNLSLRQLLSKEYNERKISLLNFSDITKMNIYSGEISKTSVGLNLGADYMLDDNWTIFANTLALFAGKNNNFYFNIGASYKFNCSICSDKSDNKLQEINDRSKNLEDELAKKKKELEEAEQREKELKDMLQKYQSKIFSEQEAKKIRETQIKEIRLDEKPTFVFAKAKLNAEGQKSLKEVAKELSKYPNSEILIEGHTDNIGTDKYNDDLSLRRAAAIMEVLKRDYNVKNKIGIIGKGKKEPVYSNTTKFGRAKNRRVEIVIGAPR